MSTLIFTQTRTIEAIKLATSTNEEVAEFLNDTPYTFSGDVNETGNIIGVLHLKGREPHSEGRKLVWKDEYLLKADGKLQAPTHSVMFNNIW